MYSQSERLVPFGVEAGADRFGLLLGLIFGIWYDLELHIWIRQPIGVHGNEVSGFSH